MRSFLIKGKERSLVSGNLEHAVDFDRRTKRQSRAGDGRAGVAALVAEDLDHEVGTAIDDFRNIEKARRRGDKSTQLHHALQAIQVAVTGGAELGDKVDGAQACRGLYGSL